MSNENNDSVDLLSGDQGTAKVSPANQTSQGPGTQSTGAMPGGNVNSSGIDSGFWFDQPQIGIGTSQLGEDMVESLNKDYASVMTQISRTAISGTPIKVESLYVHGSNVGSNSDMISLFVGPYNGVVYSYMIALSNTPVSLVPNQIITELTNNHQGRGTRNSPLNVVKITGLDRLGKEVSKQINSIKGSARIVEVALIDGRSFNTKDEAIRTNLKENFIQVFIKSLIGGSRATKISGLLGRYRPNSIVAIPTLNDPAKHGGTTINEVGSPVRSDWKIQINGTAEHDNIRELITLTGYNDVVVTNVPVQGGPAVARMAPHLITTGVSLPSGASADIGSVCLAMSTMNAMAEGSLPIVPFVQARNNPLSDPMAFEIITHALQQSGLDTSKKIPKNLDLQSYYKLVMQHFDSTRVARSIDITENTPMATLTAELLEIAMDHSVGSMGSSNRLYDAINVLTDGHWAQLTAGKTIPIFTSVYTQPAGYIMPRSGEMTDIRSIDVMRILTKKDKEPTSFAHPDIAVNTLLSDIKRDEALGYWAAVMNIMAPQANITGITYRCVFNPDFLNTLTLATNAAGFMPNVMASDMGMSGITNMGPSFQTNNWTGAPTVMGGGISQHVDYNRI